MRNKESEKTDNYIGSYLVCVDCSACGFKGGTAVKDVGGDATFCTCDKNDICPICGHLYKTSDIKVSRQANTS